MADFSKQVVLVTGAGGGIGCSIASHFAHLGATAVLHYRSSKKGAEATAQELEQAGLTAECRQGDLTDADQVSNLIDGIVQDHQRLDVLINNAGSYPLSPMLDLEASEWHAVLDANLTSVQLCTQAAARHMKTQGRGAIVNIASVEGMTPAPLHPHYAAAKAGVIMHTRSAALEFGPLGIRVNAVSPGLISRPGLAEAWPEGVERWEQSAPLGRLGLPENIAKACSFLASEDASWITGANLPVDGGILSRSVF